MLTSGALTAETLKKNLILGCIVQTPGQKNNLKVILMSGSNIFVQTS